MADPNTFVIRSTSCPCPKSHACDLYTIMPHLQSWRCILDASSFWSSHVSLKSMMHHLTTALSATPCQRPSLFFAVTFWLLHYAQACSSSYMHSQAWHNKPLNKHHPWNLWLVVILSQPLYPASLPQSTMSSWSHFRAVNEVLLLLQYAPWYVKVHGLQFKHHMYSSFYFTLRISPLFHALFIGVRFLYYFCHQSTYSSLYPIVTSHPAESHLVEKGLHAGGGDRPVKLEIKQHQEVVVLTELNSRM